MAGTKRTSQVTSHAGESTGYRATVNDKRHPKSFSRNEEAFNSTRNMVYSLKVFYFLLYRRGYFSFVSELI